MVFEVVTKRTIWYTEYIEADSFDDAKQKWENTPVDEFEELYAITNTDTDETIEY